jgi:hypothetical protein
MDNEINIITDYISVWAWQLIAVMFLITSLIISVHPRNVSQIVVFILSSGCYFVFQIISLKKKNDFYKE